MNQAGQTRKTFADKWNNNEEMAFHDTLREGSDIHRWILTRNGFENAAALEEYLRGRSRILDAGCGNGRVTALLRRHSPPTAEVLGVDLVASMIAAKNLSGVSGVSFAPADILEDMGRFGSFDFIYCQEVLHHTADPVLGFGNLCRLLRPGGEIAIYVYKKKAPVREFVDDYVRERISGLDYENALEVSRQITELGRALSESNATVTVPEIPVLEIKAGQYDVQRLVYHFFMKCFWNPGMSYEDNVGINYDWYHPQLCSRHTLAEVTEWFRNQGLELRRTHEDFYGITVWGARPGR